MPGEVALLRLLLDQGAISQDGAERAALIVERAGGSLVDVLLDLALTQEDALTRAIAQILDIPRADPGSFLADALEGIPIAPRFLAAQRVLPLTAGAQTLVVAMADPFDQYALKALRLAAARDVSVMVASRSALDAVLRGNAIGQVVPASAATSVELDIAKLRDSAEDAPVVRWVNRLIAQAVDAGASDIHLEPQERKLRVRMRVDGVLQDLEPAPIEMSAAILSRLKIIGGLNIAERRLPQDGAAIVPVRGRPVEIRIATAPVADGEAAAIRILDRTVTRLDLETLGFQGERLRQWRELCTRPNGILLVTGPTGSGKTTTLYASLNAINAPGRKIVTIEDPIEYKIEGINQIQVKPEIGLTFAHALRTILRHDPDVVLIGEIRDGETARIAVQAALTGRLVLSTLHTGSAAGAVARLTDMGVEPYLLASTLNASLGQRLVRAVCPACKGPLAQAEQRSRCDQCRGTGFSGRIALQELMVPGPAIRDMIRERASEERLHAAAVRSGLISLWDDGLRQVRLGRTTVEEVRRAVYDETGIISAP
jgi:general secretion pathway protein E